MIYYYAIIKKAGEGGFVAVFPDIPEAFTQGDDIPECIEMATDVLNISLEEYVRERRELPVPSSFEEVTKIAENLFLDPEETKYIDTSFAPLVQIIFAEDMSQKPVKIMVSFPKGYLQDIDKKAEQLGMTRSGFLVKAALAYE